MPVTIVPVETAAQWHDFHHLLFKIYAHDPQWVAPLLLERKFHFQAKHNPFFQHAKAAFFLAYRGKEPVGRITAQIDQLHLDRYNDATGHFGFLEAVDDAEVFAALIAAAESWLRENGMRRVVGPVSFSLWDQPGLLVDGFDTPPSVMMGHHLPYYEKHIVAAGYHQAEDLIAYRYGPEAPTATLEKLLARAMRGGEITLRNIRMDKEHFDSEIAMMLDIINDAWSDNWGYVPMTKAEIDDMAGILKVLLRPGDVAIAEYQGKPAAFAAIFPNLNEAIRDMNGRLFPFNIFKLLWRMKVSRTKTARMPMMGVRKSLQASPIGAALALSVIKSVRDFNFARGVVDSDLSWILARNTRVRHVIEMVGGVPYKTYRVYEKPL
ncbi:MAG: yghO [Alphaproteobacteria bacterium]|nr:yghO [Alphaproteobacteria bacterium]